MIEQTEAAISGVAIVASKLLGRDRDTLMLRAANRVAQIGAAMHAYSQTPRLEVLHAVETAQVMPDAFVPRNGDSPRAERYSRFLADSFPHIVWIASREGRLEYVNGHCLQYIGSTFRELTGDGWTRMLHSRDVDNVWGAWRRCLSNGEPLNVEARLHCANGEFHWHLIRGLPVRGANAQITRWVGTCVDINDQKLATEALRASEDRYRALFEASPQPMWVYDPKSLAFSAVNTATVKHYGYSRDEFLHMTLPDIRPPEEVPALMESLEHTGAEPAPPRFCRHRRKDASVIHVEVTTSEVVLDSQPSRLVVITDVTERKKLEEHFIQSQKMEAIGRLAGGVAHDFNNHLTVINGFSEIMISRLGGNKGLREMVDEIRKSGERAADLTRQLLSFSRRQVVAPQVLDLNAVITDMGKMLRRVIGEDVSLVLQLDPTLYPVTIDIGQFEQVIVNLAVNARDAMAQGGTLRIVTKNLPWNGTESVGSKQSLVRLSVVDTGAGIPPEVREHIFEPFFTTKDAGKGTGLGLATVYSIVQQSEGRIEVESEPGRGTSFHIFLPGIKRPSRAGRTNHDSLASAPRGVETVLLVEDDESVRELSRFVLQAQGYTVLESRNAETAIRECETHKGPIHLLVTDVVMPGLNGQRLIERLRSIRPQMAVLCVSGYTDDEVERCGIERGSVNYLQKPFAPPILARKVREVLDAGK